MRYGIRVGSRLAALAVAASGLALATTAEVAHATVLSDCSEGSFRSAVAAGGTVTWNQSCPAIPLTSPVVIGPGLNVLIDGGTTNLAFTPRVGLDAQNLGRHFLVQGGHLQLTGIGLARGKVVGVNRGFGAPGVTPQAADNGDLGSSSSSITCPAGGGATADPGGPGGDGDDGANGTNGGNALAGGEVSGASLLIESGTVDLTTVVISAPVAMGGNGGTGGAGGSGAAGGSGGAGGQGQQGKKDPISGQKCVGGGRGGDGGLGGLGGDGAPGGKGGNGGDVRGGVILNKGTLTITGSAIENPVIQAGRGGDGGAGGAGGAGGRGGDGGQAGNGSSTDGGPGGTGGNAGAPAEAGVGARGGDGGQGGRIFGALIANEGQLTTNGTIRRSGGGGFDVFAGAGGIGGAGGAGGAGALGGNGGWGGGGGFDQQSSAPFQGGNAGAGGAGGKAGAGAAGGVGGQGGLAQGGSVFNTGTYTATNLNAAGGLNAGAGGNGGAAGPGGKGGTGGTGGRGGGPAPAVAQGSSGQSGGAGGLSGKGGDGGAAGAGGGGGVPGSSSGGAVATAGSMTLSGTGTDVRGTAAGGTGGGGAPGGRGGDGGAAVLGGYAANGGSGLGAPDGGGSGGGGGGGGGSSAGGVGGKAGAGGAGAAGGPGLGGGIAVLLGGSLSVTNGAVSGTAVGGLGGFGGEGGDGGNGGAGGQGNSGGGGGNGVGTGTGGNGGSAGGAGPGGTGGLAGAAGAGGAGGVARGGGIYAGANVQLQGVTMSASTAWGGAGQVAGNGGDGGWGGAGGIGGAGGSGGFAQTTGGGGSGPTGGGAGGNAQPATAAGVSGVGGDGFGGAIYSEAPTWALTTVSITNDRARGGVGGNASTGGRGGFGGAGGAGGPAGTPGGDPHAVDGLDGGAGGKGGNAGASAKGGTPGNGGTGQGGGIYGDTAPSTYTGVTYTSNTLLGGAAGGGGCAGFGGCGGPASNGGAGGAGGNGSSGHKALDDPSPDPPNNGENGPAGASGAGGTAGANGPTGAEGATQFVDCNPVVCGGSNHAPIGSIDAYDVAPGGTLIVPAATGVLANDADADGQALTATLVDNVDHGNLSLAANGGFSYVPTAGFKGTDTFLYKAGDGTAFSPNVTVTITVDRRPTAANDTPARGKAGMAITLSAPGVLVNDSDPDGDALTAVKVTSPTHGTATLGANGALTYTPSAGYHGQDSFTYRVSDGLLFSLPATVNLRVNAAPVAVADAYSTPKDTSLVVGEGTGLLLNDSDADVDGLTTTLVGSPSHGTVVVGNRGSFSYNPAAGFVGTDTFTYKTSDGVDVTPATTVTITVTGGPAYAPFANWSEFVKRQYVDLTAKQPTSSSLSSWVSQLTSGAKKKGDLIEGLRRGTDNTTNVDPVARLYRAFLGRIPDAGGLKFWVNRKRAGTWSVTKMADNFAASNEFKTKYGTLTNRQFVTRIYTDVLGRTADAAGVNYWTGKLDRKEKTRGQVMVGFSESSEYKRKQAENTDVAIAYIYLLGRSPTTAESNAWTTRQKAGTAQAVLAGELLDSAAYATHITG